MKRKIPGILLALISIAMIASGFYLEANEIDLFSPKTNNVEEQEKENPEKEQEKKEEEKENTENNKENSSIIPGLDIKNLEPTDENVTKLYNMIQLKEANNNIFYEQDKMLASALPAFTKLKLTIQNMEVEPGISKQFSEEAVIANYQKLFGSSSTYQFAPSPEESCMKITKNEENMLQVENQCPSTYEDLTQRQVYKAVQSGGDIYIYEVVAFHKFRDETKNTSDIYSDYQRTVLVKENVTVNKDPKNYQGIMDDLNDLPQYKYTFKLGDNQNYYFYGVEKILYL